MLVALLLVGCTAVQGAMFGPVRAASALSTPPPTPGADGSPSPFQTVLHTPNPSAIPPVVGAAAAILEDGDTGQVLFEKNARARRPVASLTKIVTAIVVAGRRSPDSVVTVGPKAVSQGGSVLGLRVGERITVRNLLYALLLQSSNDAAVALAEATAGSVDGFAVLMNQQAEALGLHDSHFTDPSGLDNSGYSTAGDVALLTRAFLEVPLLATIARTKARDIPAPSGPPRHVQNRNVLLWLYGGVTGVKTGFTTPAGNCFSASATRGGRRLVAVVLGHPFDAFSDAAALLDFGFAGFSDETLVHLGEAAGSILVQGIAVPVVAGGDIRRLVWLDQLGSIERTLLPRSNLTLPVAAGEHVGHVIVRVGGVRIGSVPALAAAGVVSPAPPASPTEAGPPSSRPTPDGSGGHPNGPSAIEALRPPIQVLSALARFLFGSFL